MIKNYLKIAWRNILRNKGFAALNIFGLAIGLTVTALIMLWVQFELGFEKFHENDASIYQVYNQYPVDGELWTWNSTPKIMAPTIKNTYPEVERISRYNYDNEFLFINRDAKVKGNGTFVDPDFLHIFNFPLLQGDIDQVLDGVNSVVITESFAQKLFGNTDPIGHSVTIDQHDVFTVTGVLEDLPQNTEFTFEFLVPWKYLIQKGWSDENWGNNSVATYLRLKKGTDFTNFSNKFKTLRKNHDKDSPEMISMLYPFSRGHLYGEFENGVETGGQITIIRMFALIAIIVLIIACINFMNLSTARSEKRAKEVGIKKVIGAQKSGLVAQFMGESILLAFISALLALAFIIAFLPTFSTIIEKPLTLNLTDPYFWLVALGIVIITGILAGSYPALYLSAFRPASVLKGTFQKQHTLITPRKVLVIAQFAVAIILISATLIVKQQLNKVQDRQLGYSKNNLVYAVLEGESKEKYELIKQELLASGTASAVTKTMSPITENWSNSWDISWAGKALDDKTLILRFNADDDVIKTFGLELSEGRDFDKKAFPTDSTAMIINETAAKHMGFEQPIGQKIRDNGQDWHVVGVVKDFVLTSPFQKIEPIIIHCAWANNFLNMRLAPNKTISEHLAQAEQIFKKHNPDYPFNYKFVDQEYQRKFANHKRTENLIWGFTLLTIFISCLGLFGLASYMAENRIKEIGVRKVLGASVTQITSLLSTSFLKLIGFASLIGIPISWFIMDKWLQEFDFRIQISLWIFIGTSILAMAVALITISYQAIKAALQNPVKSLRTE